VLINPGGAMLEGRSSWDPFIATVDVPDLQSTSKATRQVFGRIPQVVLYAGLRSFQNLFRRSVVRAFVSAATEQDFLTPDDLHAIHTPTLIIWGIRDRFLPLGSLHFFRTHITGAHILELEHCGHLPQRERPRSLVRAIRTFENSLRSKPTSTFKLSADVLQ
jgi:pimeloyl-ACP methyl ester carboxylesterase